MLIFSPWTSLLDILEALLGQLLGLPFLRLDGSTRVDTRQALIDEFNAPDRPPAPPGRRPPPPRARVFLLSTRAGGLGINLTGADTVILHDLSFNPQVSDWGAGEGGGLQARTDGSCTAMAHGCGGPQSAAACVAMAHGHGSRHADGSDSTQQRIWSRRPTRGSSSHSLAVAARLLYLTRLARPYLRAPHITPTSSQDDAQAVDRAHRLGQKRPVTVLRLVTSGTVDEGVYRLAASKTALDAALKGGRAGDQGEGVDLPASSIGELLARALSK